MKSLLLPLVGLFGCLASGFAQSTLLSDDFNTNTLNTNLWQVLAPLSDSQMTASGGTAVFFQRGVLITKQDLPTSIEIRGRFAFTGGTYDTFQVALRTDGTLVPPYFPFQSAVSIGFNRRGGDDGDQTGRRNIGLSLGTGVPGLITDFTFQTGTFYDFRIVDDGRVITVYLNNLTTPILTGISTERTGYKVGFVNRGFVPFFPLRDNQVKMDSVSISAPVAPPAAPIISSQSSVQTALEGESTSFSVNATSSVPVTYQWLKDGAPITGATSASLDLRAIKVADSGAYSVRITSSAGSVASGTSLLVVRATPPEAGRLINISTLGNGGFVTGFVVGGAASRNVLVRAVGPTLRTLGVGDAATQTSLTLNSGVVPIATNTGWSATQNASQVAGVGGAFPLPNGSADSAILMNLLPGNYTAKVTSNGTVLLEVYEVP